MFQYAEINDTSSSTCLVLVNDIVINPCPGTSIFPPKIPSANTKDIDGMPFLNLEELQGCNCYKNDHTPSPVIIQTTEVKELVQQAQNLKIADKKETVSLSIPIKGSTYGQSYQDNLKKARLAISENGQLDAYFQQEPQNPKDVNAIAIYIKLGDKSFFGG